MAEDVIPNIRLFCLPKKKLQTSSAVTGVKLIMEAMPVSIEL